VTALTVSPFLREPAIAFTVARSNCMGPPAIEPDVSSTSVRFTGLRSVGAASETTAICSATSSLRSHEPSCETISSAPGAAGANEKR
jgi:hypothetical protein